jgi:hypothetical protein
MSEQARCEFWFLWDELPFPKNDEHRKQLLGNGVITSRGVINYEARKINTNYSDRALSKTSMPSLP